MDRQGDIVAREAKIVADGGAYSGWGQASIFIAGMFLCLPYRYGSYRYEGVRAFTNNPVSSAMRGHTAPQVQFASDAQIDMLAEDIDMDPVKIRLRNALDSSDKRLHFKQAARMWQEAHNFTPLVAGGSYDPSDKLHYAAYSFGVQVAEVEVNEETGQIKVANVFCAHDCGQMVNPMAVEGQLEGSVHMGIGFALSEDMMVRQGQVLNLSLIDYAIPLSGDMPAVKCIHIGIIDPEGPFGAKECGEGTVGPTAPAVINALYHATKRRFRDLPVTPAQVLKGGEKI